MMAMPTARATHEPSRKRLGLTVGIAIALVGCSDDPPADPYIKRACTKSHMQLTLIPQSNGKTTTITQIWMRVCDASVLVCIDGAKHKCSEVRQ